MIRPKLLLAIAFCACMTTGGGRNAFAVQKAAPAAKGAWQAAEVPASSNDPAYAAYDSGQYEQALKLAAEAAAKGEIQANTLIGKLYAEGLVGVRQDDAKAAEWFTKGAVAGDMHAQFELGVMLANGRGVKKDEKKAAGFFEAAAQQGHTLAAYNLAQTYVEGWARPQDFQKAAYWLEQAAKKDHAQAAYDLAALYRSGDGVLHDEAKAAAWLAKAAADGHADAQVEYAIMLANGQGVAKDEAAAVALLRVAAERGNPVAQNRLARAYSAGLGLNKDRIQAAKWHILARAAGESDFRLDLFVISLRPDERKQAESLARAWREQTAEAAR